MNYELWHKIILLIKEVESNPYRMKIHWKTIANTQRSIAKAFELQTELEGMNLE